MQEIVWPLNTETPQTDTHSTHDDESGELSPPSPYNSKEGFDSLLINSPQGNHFDVEGAISGGYNRHTK